MITEFKNPIPVISPLGDGYAIYVKENGMHENDVWTIVLKDGGKIMNFLTNQIIVHSNKTYSIEKSKDLKYESNE
jgi:phosphoheptose isomerase